MSNSSSESNVQDDDMLPEYDFTSGVRGKHYQAYREGHTVTVHQADGSMTTQHFILEDGAIMLDPDVRQHFSDSESVNHALRTLIRLVLPNQGTSES